MDASKRVNKAARSLFGRSTYREVDLAAFGHLFRKDSQEIQDSCMALHLASKGRDNSGQDILPRPHLYCENGQAYAELHTDGPRTRGVLL